MRMFLVGMCDIFLLLYLTALAEVEARPVSSITVQDFLQLKASKELLEQQEQSNKAALEGQEREASQLRKELAALMNERQRVESEKHKAERELALLQKSTIEQVERTRAESTEAIARLERLQEQVRKESEEREAKLTAQISERQATLEHERLKAEERTKQLALEEQRSVQLRSHIEQQQALVDAAKKTADEALADKVKALEDRQQALAEADQARKAREQALSYASQAISRAESGNELADVALRRAREAEQERLEARDRVKRITQSAATAFERNIKAKIVPVETAVHRRAVLGESVRRATLHLLPVQFGEELVLFVPLAHLGLADVDDVSEVKAVDIRIVGQRATRVYHSRQFPGLLAIVAPLQKAAVLPLRDSSVRSLMPTLMAVRSGAGAKVGDRIRDLSASHFLFPRDRLIEDRGQRLRLAVEGFRGTGDFGEQILMGDQIVDLDGNFLGLAGSVNEVTVISSLDEWQSFDIENGGLASLVESFK